MTTTFIILITWIICGIISFILSCKRILKDEDLNLGYILLFLIIAWLGYIELFMTIIAVYGNKVIIKRR